MTNSVTIEEALVSHLTNTAAVTALIGDRVSPFHIPQGETLPCVTYKRIDTPRQGHHQSTATGGDIVTPRFQLDSWATTELAAQGIAIVLRGALHYKKGVIGVAPYAITVGLITEDGGGFPLYEPDVALWRWVSQFVIRMAE